MVMFKLSGKNDVYTTVYKIEFGFKFKRFDYHEFERFHLACRKGKNQHSIFGPLGQYFVWENTYISTKHYEFGAVYFINKFFSDFSNLDLFSTRFRESLLTNFGISRQITLSFI
jgi:hypothetical protein